MAFPADWSSKLEIRSDATKVSGSSNLTDYPSLIADGNLTSAVYAGLETDGKDLRITTDEAGTTEIPFEIVAMDTSAETCEIWAKIPTLDYDDDTSLFIWYGNSSAVAYAVDDTFGSQAVWSDYGAVYHMEGNSNDSTDGGHTGTDTSITYSTANGEIGQGAGLNGSSSKITAPDANELDLTGNHTIQTWFNTNVNNAYEAMVEKYTSGNGYYFRLNDSGELVFGNQAIPQGSNITGSTVVGTNTWKMGHGTYDGTNIRVYLNGSQDGISASYTYGNVNSAATLKLGVRGDNGSSIPYSGELDEVRIRESALSADWCLTEYNNQNSPSTFWTPVLIFTTNYLKYYRRTRFPGSITGV